jgi:hypothetical protein
MHLAVPDTLFGLLALDPWTSPCLIMPFLSRFCLLLLLPWLSGCHNPARQQVPQVEMGQREAELRKELVPGRRADRALGYLLTQGFEVRVTRDEKANVERIVATGRAVLRDASGTGRKWHVDLEIENDLIQNANFSPLAP